MRLSEIETNHCTSVARCYTTSYYAYRSCKVVKSKTKGFYKFVLSYIQQGTYPYIGTSNPNCAQPIYVVNKNYTATEIKQLTKRQEELNSK